MEQREQLLVWLDEFQFEFVFGGHHSGRQIRIAFEAGVDVLQCDFLSACGKHIPECTHLCRLPTVAEVLKTVASRNELEGVFRVHERTNEQRIEKVEGDDIGLLDEPFQLHQRVRRICIGVE